MQLADARSLLFVPGDRPERFAKAVASGADIVCIDLEDALAPAAREAARVQVVAFLATQAPGHHVGVRINSLDTADGARDLAALKHSAPAWVMLAKTERAAQLEVLAAHLPDVPQMALIESATAMLAAGSIAQAQSPLAALMLGGADLAADLGCEFAWEPLLHARSALVMAAASRHLAAIDVPCLDVHDNAGTQAETARVAALGFTGKAAIHPAQIVAIHAGMAPGASAVARARRIVEAAQANEAALLLDGCLVDRPLLLSAQRVLRRQISHVAG
jgi:(S)-citramalyl-CoA lyase